MTVNGSACSVGRADDTDFNYDFTAIFYCVSPPSGSQTVAWDWSGTNTPSDETTVHYAFYSGVDTSNPIRSSGGQATATNTASAGTLTANSGDYAFGVCYAYDSVGLPTNVTWTGLTEQADFTATGGTPADNRTSYADSAMSGNTAISASHSGGGGAAPYATVSAVVLRQSSSGIPTVLTTPPLINSYTSATANGNVTAENGASVTDRGACWSTSANPTTSDTCVSNGCGTGTFTASFTGLSSGTTYHTRSYATNSQGTAYGDDISFVTLQKSPGNKIFGTRTGKVRL